MYKVIIDGITAHDPAQDDENRLVFGGVVKKTVNTADSFVFTIYPRNPAYTGLHELTSEVTVYQDDTQIFHGRVLTTQTAWNNEKQVLCESDLALLNDTILEPYEWQGSVEGYLQLLISRHNAQTTSDKQFVVRTVTVEDPNDNIVRSNQDYSVTMAELMTKLPGSGLGGYILVEYADGVRYIDYLEDSTDATDQKVELTRNLIDFARIAKGDSLITALIPLGARDEETGQRLTVESVNDGKKYIIDEDAAESYGLIYGTQVWDDVTVPANLLAKAQAALADLSAIVPTITLKAVDLSLTDKEIESLGFFQYVAVSDTAHRVSGQYLIKERSWNLSNPESDTLTFGGTQPSISGTAAKTLQMGAQLRTETAEMIEYMTGVLTGSKGGYKVELMNEDGLPEQTLYMDTPDMETARKVLRINKDGIGFSQSGVAGPYTTAWTIDGRFAADFIQTGTLRSRNGLFSLNMDTGEVNMRNGRFSGSIYSQDATILGGTINIQTAGSGGLIVLKQGTDSDYDQSGMMNHYVFAKYYTEGSRDDETRMDYNGITIWSGYGNKKRRVVISKTGVYFYDENGNLTKSYPAT